MAVIAAIMRERPPSQASDHPPHPAHKAASKPQTPPPTPPEELSPPPASSPQPLPAGSPTGSLRIGSWNIEWLGKPADRSGQAANLPQDPTDLADYIAFSDTAILAVQEIVTTQRGRPLRSPEIEAALHSLKDRAGDQWQYVLFPGRAEGDQLTGILWNPRLVTALNLQGKPWSQTVDTPWALPIPRGRSAQGLSLWNRPPHAMKFCAGRPSERKTDFVVIPIHMKADYNGAFSSHREEEARALAAALPSVRKQFNDADIIVIGDTNFTSPREPAGDALAAQTLADLNDGRHNTHWRGGQTDRAFIPADQPEFKDRRFEAVSDIYLKARRLSPADFKRRYSDHYIIATTIAIQPDDD